MKQIQPFICPICKKENGCMVETKSTSCWCMNVTIDKQLLERVPVKLKGKQCICANCIEIFSKE